MGVRKVILKQICCLPVYTHQDKWNVLQGMLILTQKHFAPHWNESRSQRHEDRHTRMCHFLVQYNLGRSNKLLKEVRSVCFDAKANGHQVEKKRLLQKKNSHVTAVCNK